MTLYRHTTTEMYALHKIMNFIKKKNRIPQFSKLEILKIYASNKEMKIYSYKIKVNYMFCSRSEFYMIGHLNIEKE